MSVNRELNSMEKRRDTILDDDNENAIKLNDEDRNTITKNKSKDKLLKKTWVVCLLAMVCCFLWGSAFPCIKTGYRMLDIKSGEYASQILFAGIRFALAGILVIVTNSIIRRKVILPKKPGYIFTLSIFQTSGQYLFFYIGMAHTTGVRSSIITGSGVFLAIVVAAFIFHQEKLNATKIIGTLIGFAGVLIVNITGINGGGQWSFMGEGFIFLAAISSAFSSSFIKKFSNDADVVMLIGYQFFSGGVILAVIGKLLGGNVVISTPNVVIMIIYMAFISATAYTIWSILLKFNTVSKVSVYKFMNPVFGVILSALFLPGESSQIGGQVIVALMFVCVGIVIVNNVQTHQ